MRKSKVKIGGRARHTNEVLSIDCISKDIE
jgi:hypothetical protein